MQKCRFPSLWERDVLTLPAVQNRSAYPEAELHLRSSRIKTRMLRTLLKGASLESNRQKQLPGHLKHAN